MAISVRKNALNDLDGGAWLYFTKSILHQNYGKNYGHELRKAHGANKPPELCETIIRFFTKEDEHVFDPFAGVGGTLLGCSLANRRGTGIELMQKWVDIYCACVDQTGLALQDLMIGNCLEIMLVLVESNSVDFILTDPPYGPTLKQTMRSKKAKIQNRKTDFYITTQEADDFGNSGSYEAFLSSMALVLEQCSRVLKDKKYMAFFMRNNYVEGEYQFIGADLARLSKHYGFSPRGNIVQYQDGARLSPYGMPYSFVQNNVHHDLVILQKR